MSMSLYPPPMPNGPPSKSLCTLTLQQESVSGGILANDPQICASEKKVSCVGTAIAPNSEEKGVVGRSDEEVTHK